MANDDGVLEIKEDNTKAIKAALNQAMAQGLETVGLVAEGAAKKLCPVDTGRLRNSITHLVQPSEKAVYIGTNVEYGPFVEFREDLHHTTGQAHYLRDAATNNVGKYKAIMEAALKK